MKVQEKTSRPDANTGQPSAINTSKPDRNFGGSLRSLAAGLMLGGGLDIDVKAGIPAPGVPYEVYEEAAKLTYGPKVGDSVNVRIRFLDSQTGITSTNILTGVVLNQRVVLTAQHGFHSKNSSDIFSGCTISWQGNALESDPNAIPGKAVFMEGYDPSTFANDLAAIILPPTQPLSKFWKDGTQDSGQIEVAKTRPSEGTILTINGFGRRADGTYTGRPMKGNIIMTGDGYPVFGLPSDSYFAMYADASYGDQNPAAWPIMAPNRGDSGAGVLIQGDKKILVGIVVRGDARIPGDSVAFDLTSPKAQAFLKPLTVEEPRDVRIDCTSDEPCIAWTGTDPKNVTIEASRNLIEWAPVLPSKPATQDSSGKWMCTVPTVYGQQTFYRLKWQPSL